MHPREPCGAMSGFVRSGESPFDLFECHGFAPSDLVTAGFGEFPLLVGVGFVIPLCSSKGSEQWIAGRIL